METRALVFLTLPPKYTSELGDDEIVNQVNLTFNQFLMDAQSCSTDADALLKSDTTANDMKLHQPAPVCSHFHYFHQ